MASEDQVRQFLDNSSTSTSGSSSEDSSDEQADTSPEPSPTSVPPKVRIKLSLKMSKTPVEDEEAAAEPKDDTAVAMETTTSAAVVAEAPSEEKKQDKEEQVKEEASNDTGTDEAAVASAEEVVVEATVVNTSDEGDGNDDEPEVQVEAEPIKSTAPAPATKKRQTSAPARAVRLPPMASPGLLIPPTAGVYRGQADANGFTTPASVFDYCMSLAGYTTEARTERPHRGSSVRRVVGDMFDSNVAFTLHFPPLVPKQDWNATKKQDNQNSNDQQQVKEEDGQRNKVQELLSALAPPAKKGNGDAKSVPSSPSTKPSRKRRRPYDFSEMAPLSLTMPYPDSYVDKRIRYVELVKERERAIVASQEAAEKAEVAMEKYNAAISSKKKEPPPPPQVPAPIQVPPIPEPPSPPRLSELQGVKVQGLDESNHPLYVPKTNETFTAHLDPSCFHITDGRYFGLLSNSIADPNFVGPSAPGITGLTGTHGGTGLATSYVGSGERAPSVSTLNAQFFGSGGSGSSNQKTTAASGKKKQTPTTIFKVTNGGTPAVVAAARGAGGPAPTSTSTELKKIMEMGGEQTEEMRECIMRAAVHASRTGKHGQSFLGPNGERYPDISKAFAAHAGLRPCIRCKNNKQGAYHCRLKRKHKDLDYDGQNSPAILAPLFEEQLEDLIVKTT